MTIESSVYVYIVIKNKLYEGVKFKIFYFTIMIKKIILSLILAAAFVFAADPVTIEGRLTEIPGKMPSNDLYSYVYVFKYKVSKVVSGKLDAKEVLVGVYNPLIARGKVKDKMADKAKGNVGEFKAKAKHTLKLIPLEGNWDGAVEDEYFDDESPRYLAIEVNEWLDERTGFALQTRDERVIMALCARLENFVSRLRLSLNS